MSLAASSTQNNICLHLYTTHTVGVAARLARERDVPPDVPRFAEIVPVRPGSVTFQSTCSTVFPPFPHGDASSKDLESRASSPIFLSHCSFLFSPPCGAVVSPPIQLPLSPPSLYNCILDAADPRGPISSRFPLRRKSGALRLEISPTSPLHLHVM